MLFPRYPKEALNQKNEKNGLYGGIFSGNNRIYK
jgi:hypothetical protein